VAKAKLAIAIPITKKAGAPDSSNRSWNIKDFITFFPFLDEAPYAQLQIGMAHTPDEKPDRDRAEP